MPNMYVWRKNDYSIPLVAKVNGVVRDITGATIYFTVKENETDAYADAKIKKTITEHDAPIIGESTLSLTHDDTNLTAKEYHFAFLLVTSDGDEETLGDGKFIVNQNICFDYDIV